MLGDEFHEGIVSKGMDRLLERHLVFEAHAVESDDEDKDDVGWTLGGRATSRRDSRWPESDS